MTRGKQIIWRDPKGEVIACVEKSRVLQENLAELVDTLASPYPPRE